MIKSLVDQDVCFDSHVLMYFSQVGLTPEMRQTFGGHLHLGDAVQWEVRQAVVGYAITAIRPVLDPPPWYRVEKLTDAAELSEVAVFQRDWEAKHGLEYNRWINRGEAESLVLCKRTKWVFVSNDRDAVETGKLRNVNVISPVWVLLVLIDQGLMTADEGWDRYRRMRALQMGNWTFCPHDARGKVFFMEIATALAATP